MSARELFAPLMAVLMLALSLVVMTGSPATSATGFNICHATGVNPRVLTIEDVKKYERPGAADNGDISGHEGTDHMNGLDIIAPVAGLPEGQNWTVYGRQVYDNGCTIPDFLTVAATFTDQRCTQQQTYVAPSFTAPTYAGVTRTITGAGANGVADPGETITVTYTGSTSTILTNADANNAKTFSHAFPTEPSGLQDCVPQPPAATRSIQQRSSSCSPAGVTTWTDVYTTPYFWNANQGRWVLGQETGPVRTSELFTPYTDQQYFNLCAPDQPADDQRREPQSEPSCSLAGVTSWTDVYTTSYVWDMGERRWVLGQETGPVRTGEAFTAYTDQEYFDNCPTDQPEAEQRRVPRSEPTCQPAGVTSWTDVYTTPYVWNLAERRWELGEESGPVRSGESFTHYSDAEYFAECAPDQPQDDTRGEPQSEPSCDPAGVTHWLDVYTTPYVWNMPQRAWVPGAETGPVRAAVTFLAYTDAEYLENCAPDQPPAAERREPQGVPSCELGGVTSWTDLYTTPYVWNDAERKWELGTETGPTRVGQTFTAYAAAEYKELCGGDQPQAEQRRVPRSEPSCELGGVTSWTDLFITPYVWDGESRDWVLGTETGPQQILEGFVPYTGAEYKELCGGDQPQAEQRRVPRSEPSCELGGVTSWTDLYVTPYVWEDESRDWMLGTETGPQRIDGGFTPYSDAEYQRLCGGDQPASEQRRLPQSDASCELGGVTSWTDVYTTPYLWNVQTRVWELGQETGPVKIDERFTPYTDEEYFAECAEAQPADLVVEVAGVQASCELQGTTTWVDVFTTTSVWNPVTRAWELGEQTGPVRTDEVYVPYSEEAFEEVCLEEPEVKGEQGQVIKHELPEVPASPAVPTAVDAGLGGAESPLGSPRNPLWLLAVVGGLGLMGSAGLRRRAANR